MMTDDRDEPRNGAATASRAGRRSEPRLVDSRDFVQLEVAGQPVLVSGKCPHRGASMAEATVVGPYLICKRHGATFDLRTGAWVRGPKCSDIKVTRPHDVEKT